MYFIEKSLRGTQSVLVWLAERPAEEQLSIAMTMVWPRWWTWASEFEGALMMLPGIMYLKDRAPWIENRPSLMYRITHKRYIYLLNGTVSDLQTFFRYLERMYDRR